MNQSRIIQEQLGPINEPSSVVKSFAAKSGKTEDEVEKLWDKLKDQAEEKGFTGDRLYRYVVGTLKKILKIGD